MSLESMIRMNQLFAYYQDLLTDKQREMLSLYYEEDYSLAEIADYYQVSRQAVHDTLKRSEKALEQYEASLNLLARRLQREEWLNQLAPLINGNVEAEAILDKLRAYDE
ncbi:TPA: YlxM family DNA-binding protein [Streptococcus suis]